MNMSEDEKIATMKQVITSSKDTLHLLGNPILASSRDADRINLARPHLDYEMLNIYRGYCVGILSRDYTICPLVVPVDKSTYIAYFRNYCLQEGKTLSHNYSIDDDSILMTLGEYEYDGYSFLAGLWSAGCFGYMGCRIAEDFRLMTDQGYVEILYIDRTIQQEVLWEQRLGLRRVVIPKGVACAMAQSLEFAISQILESKKEN